MPPQRRSLASPAVRPAPAAASRAGQAPWRSVRLGHRAGRRGPAPAYAFGTAPALRARGDKARALLRPAYAQPLMTAVRQASLAMTRTIASGPECPVHPAIPLARLVMGP